MRKYLVWRILIVAVTIAVALWYLYPPRKTINLGLDLQGGIHLVLGVEVDKALENITERTAADLRASLEKKGIGIASLARQGTTEISLQLTNSQTWDEAVKTLNDFSTLQRKAADQAKGQMTLALREAEVNRIKDFSVRQGVETIRNRVDQFGVAEPTIQRQGENRILIQLPGIKDPERAKALIGKTAQLEFRMLDEQADPTKPLPEGDEVLYQQRVDPKTGQEQKTPYVVRKQAALTGDLLSIAEVRLSPDTGEPYVSVEFNKVGAKVFGDLTAANVGKRLAIVLDGNVHSAPVIREKIPSGQAQITGGFTPEEARDLAIILRAGALPAPVKILEERTVGPSLGADSIKQGVTATLVGALTVVIFMILYYRLSGLIADVALLLNLLILLATMAGFRATLTLPGIAGIVLTIGMAVDTNILIFERIREEARAGKTVRAAIEAGFKRAFKTVIDTHVTVFVSAAILYHFGTGPVKGFAVSLAIGILASLFTAVFFTRLLFDLIYTRRWLVRLSI